MRAGRGVGIDSWEGKGVGRRRGRERREYCVTKGSAVCG